MKIVSLLKLNRIMEYLEQGRYPWVATKYSIASLSEKKKERLKLYVNRNHQGDCRKILRKLPPNSIDSLVTDPPSGISFMGASWDTFSETKSGFKGKSPANEKSKNPFFKSKGQPISESSKARNNFIEYISSIMEECYRVMKPGAFGLVWALPRTSHWTAIALEEAGFEIRDCIYHSFGTGFPKSRDIWKTDIKPEIEKQLREQGVNGEIKWVE